VRDGARGELRFVHTFVPGSTCALEPEFLRKKRGVNPFLGSFLMPSAGRLRRLRGVDCIAVAMVGKGREGGRDRLAESTMSR
jgi:hypothetical protein